MFRPISSQTVNTKSRKTTLILARIRESQKKKKKRKRNTKRPRDIISRVSNIPRTNPGRENREKKPQSRQRRAEQTKPEGTSSLCTFERSFREDGEK